MKVFLSFRWHRQTPEIHTLLLLLLLMLVSHRGGCTSPGAPQLLDGTVGGDKGKVPLDSEKTILLHSTSGIKITVKNGMDEDLLMKTVTNTQSGEMPRVSGELYEPDKANESQSIAAGEGSIDGGTVGGINNSGGRSERGPVLIVSEDETLDKSSPPDNGSVVPGKPKQRGPTTPPNHRGPSTPPHYSGHTTTPNQSGPTTLPNHSGPSTPPNHRGATTLPNHSGPSTPPNHRGPSTPPNHSGPSTPPNHSGPSTPPNHRGHTTPAQKQVPVNKEEPAFSHNQTKSGLSSNFNGSKPIESIAKNNLVFSIKSEENERKMNIPVSIEEIEYETEDEGEENDIFPPPESQIEYTDSIEPDYRTEYKSLEDGFWFILEVSCSSSGSTSNSTIASTHTTVNGTTSTFTDSTSSNSTTTSCKDINWQNKATQGSILQTISSQFRGAKIAELPLHQQQLKTASEATLLRLNVSLNSHQIPSVPSSQQERLYNSLLSDSFYTDSFPFENFHSGQGGDSEGIDNDEDYSVREERILELKRRRWKDVEVLNTTLVLLYKWDSSSSPPSSLSASSTSLLVAPPTTIVKGDSSPFYMSLVGIFSVTMTTIFLLTLVTTCSILACTLCCSSHPAPVPATPPAADRRLLVGDRSHALPYDSYSDLLLVEEGRSCKEECIPSCEEDQHLLLARDGVGREVAREAETRLVSWSASTWRSIYSAGSLLRTISHLFTSTKAYISIE